MTEIKTTKVCGETDFIKHDGELKSILGEKMTYWAS
jgi:hypothetical protein